MKQLKLNNFKATYNKGYNLRLLRLLANICNVNLKSWHIMFIALKTDGTCVSQKLKQ